FLRSYLAPTCNHCTWRDGQFAWCSLCFSWYAHYQRFDHFPLGFAVGKYGFLCAARGSPGVPSPGLVRPARREEAMKRFRMFGVLALLVLVIVFPVLIPDAGFESIAIYTLLYAAAVTGWNLFSGYSGYISLGYSSFTGIGAYTLALICTHWQIPGGYIPFLLL